MGAKREVIVPKMPAARPARYQEMNTAPIVTFESGESQGSRQLFKPKAQPTNKGG